MKFPTDSQPPTKELHAAPVNFSSLRFSLPKKGAQGPVLEQFCCSSVWHEAEPSEYPASFPGPAVPRGEPQLSDQKWPSILLGARPKRRLNLPSIKKKQKRPGEHTWF